MKAEQLNLVKDKLVSSSELIIIIVFKIKKKKLSFRCRNLRFLILLFDRIRFAESTDNSIKESRTNDRFRFGLSVFLDRMTDVELVSEFYRLRLFIRFRSWRLDSDRTTTVFSENQTTLCDDSETYYLAESLS